MQLSSVTELSSIDLDDDDDIESDNYDSDEPKIDLSKLDSRRKLEIYFENKQLEKELYDF